MTADAIIAVACQPPWSPLFTSPLLPPPAHPRQPTMSELLPRQLCSAVNGHLSSAPCTQRSASAESADEQDRHRHTCRHALTPHSTVLSSSTAHPGGSCACQPHARAAAPPPRNAPAHTRAAAAPHSHTTRSGTRAAAPPPARAGQRSLPALLDRTAALADSVSGWRPALSPVSWEDDDLVVSQPGMHGDCCVADGDRVEKRGRVGAGTGRCSVPVEEGGPARAVCVAVDVTHLLVLA